MPIAVDGLDIRYLGLYDPVNHSVITPTTQIANIVQHSSVGVATNFVGNDPQEVSRHYWERITYPNATATRNFSATHSAFQGSPTYSTDGGQFFATLPGDPFNPGLMTPPVPTSAPITGHPGQWIPGYTDLADVQASIDIDTWFRSQASLVGVPISSLSPVDYQFQQLHRDPNVHSPNHFVGFSQQP